MKLEDIEALWSEDTKLDRTSLDSESLKIPYLHNKYYKIFIREKLLLDKKQTELDAFLKLKWEYYNGKLDSKTLKDNNWDQFDLKVLRQDLDRYLDADPEIIEKKLSIAAQREKVKFLEDIIRSLKDRTYAIKNAIDFIKWTQGAD